MGHICKTCPDLGTNAPNVMDMANGIIQELLICLAAYVADMGGYEQSRRVTTRWYLLRILAIATTNTSAPSVEFSEKLITVIEDQPSSPIIETCGHYRSMEI